MTAGTGALSNRQRRLLVKRIRKEKKDAPQPQPFHEATTTPDEYVTPIPANGDTIVHDQGQTGRPIAVRLDPLMKLRRAGRITEDQYKAGQAYLAIVQAFFVAKSGLSRIEAEATGSVRNGDPIRLYVKGRRTYVSTQKPRIIAAPRTSFDGWSGARFDAMEAMKRVRRALARLEAEPLLALYALVIHPNMPDRRPTTLRAYVMRQYGYRNQHSEDAIVVRLQEALNGLWRELGNVASIGKAA